MNIGVIFAGGVGSRMNTKSRPKQFLEVFGKQIIIYTLEHFEQCDDIDAIVIASLEEYIDYMWDLVNKYRISKVKRIVPGGSTGQLSIYNGLCAAKEISTSDKDIVLIHDGVRPIISSALLSKNIEMVKLYGSSITCVPERETIVMVDESKELIESIPDRRKLYVARAPQSFYLKDILACHQKSINEGITNFIDSSSMMIHFGNNLHIVEGSYENIKITTPEDYYILKALLETKENAQIYGYDN